MIATFTNLSWKMFHVHLGSMCTLLLLSKSFYKCLLSPSGSGNCLAGGQPPHGDQGLSAHFPLHPLLPFMITMAAPAGRQWVLTHITPSSSPPNLDLSRCPIIP
jgi:hypothetical protein